MLDFTDEAFNQVSFPIKMPVICSARLSAVTTLGNNDFAARMSDLLHKVFGIVTFVGNQVIKNNAVNQIVRLPMVTLLAARQDKTHRVSKRVNRQMNLSGKAAATSA